MKPKVGLKGDSTNETQWSTKGSAHCQPPQQLQETTEKKWCKLHQQTTHNTGSCRLVLNQIKKMQAARDAQSPEQKAEYTRKHCKYNNSKKQANKDINVILEVAK